MFVFYEYVLPAAITEYAETKISIYETNPTAQLAKNLSYRTLDGVQINIDSVSKNDQLNNVRINYLSENRFIFAKKAFLLPKNNEKNAFPLVLFNSTSSRRMSIRTKSKVVLMNNSTPSKPSLSQPAISAKSYPMASSCFPCLLWRTI